MSQKNSLSPGQKAILTIGAFVITFITICTIFKSDIKFKLTTANIERQYAKIETNTYFTEDNFNFVDNYEKVEVKSKQEIINSIYYIINTGATHAKRYCQKEYTECYNDMLSISSDRNLLSLLNNYVHPYNSFNNITFNFNDNIIEIKIEHTYQEKDIQELNQIIKNVISENIKDTMSTKEKIKTIHDYIINTTDYDQLKNENIDDDTYKSNTAYGVLVQHFGICSGYSDAMALFLDELNIINYKISNDQHIWNLVYLDNNWLHLDLTWDDPISDKNVTRDNYFLITTKNLKQLDDDVHYFNSNYFQETKNN